MRTRQKMSENRVFIGDTEVSYWERTVLETNVDDQLVVRKNTIKY